MLHSILLAFLALMTQAESSQPRVILAFGDSMTAGYGVEAGRSYPAQLQKWLDALGYNYRVVNHGVSASTTAQGLARITRALLVQPEIVIIQFGGNDGSQGIRASVSQQNLRTMIEKFKRIGARVVFAGGRFPSLDQIAQENDIPVIRFLDGVERRPELLLGDGAHPNADGYAIVVENILKVLEPELKR